MKSCFAELLGLELWGWHFRKHFNERPLKHLPALKLIDKKNKQNEVGLKKNHDC